LSENPKGISPSSPRLPPLRLPWDRRSMNRQLQRSCASQPKPCHNDYPPFTFTSKEHHQKITFQQGLRAPLLKYEIEFDKRYL